MSPCGLRRERPMHLVPVPNATTSKSECEDKIKWFIHNTMFFLASLIIEINPKSLFSCWEKCRKWKEIKIDNLKSFHNFEFGKQNRSAQYRWEWTEHWRKKFSESNSSEKELQRENVLFVSSLSNWTVGWCYMLTRDRKSC